MDDLVGDLVGTLVDSERRGWLENSGTATVGVDCGQLWSFILISWDPSTNRPQI
jgi:hypothetical protein